MSRTFQLQFVKDRDTKNTTRYSEKVEENAAPVIGVLYVQKHASRGAQEVSITVQFPD